MDDEYVSAEEAAAMLGVTLGTLYAYVSRKLIRSQPLPGSRAHRYWRADIERLRRRERRPAPVAGELRNESSITLLTDRGPYYRGRSAIELAETSSLEAVAALLWEVDERDVFTGELPRRSKNYLAIEQALKDGPVVDRAIAHMAYLEQAHPRSYDLSAPAMARTGADIVRWIAAIMLDQPTASSEPLHLQFERVLNLPPHLTGLARRILVMIADHGFEQATYAVRAVASTGVTVWRSVATGLAVSGGRRSRFGHIEAIRRFVREITEAPDPEDVVMRMMREGEGLPGFDSEIYAHDDPRADSLLAYCESVMAGDVGLRRLKIALDLILEVSGQRPKIAIMTSFASTKWSEGFSTDMQMRSLQALYFVARSCGWVAHVMEQHAGGEAVHRKVKYSGLLPTPH